MILILEKYKTIRLTQHQIIEIPHFNRLWDFVFLNKFYYICDMKGKLIKTGDEFLLKDLNGETLAITSGTMEGRMLSLKNCQTIERGYDLGELAMGYDLYENINFVGQTRAYKAGFQKALEILGDKKFDMDDITLAFRSGIEHGLNPKKTNTTEYVQLLQQTEWDVEIVEECLDKNCDGVNKKGDCITTGIPKLDEESCLILKKL